MTEVRARRNAAVRPFSSMATPRPVVKTGAMQDRKGKDKGVYFRK